MSDVDDRIFVVECSKVRPFEGQPRIKFTTKRMNELTAGIKARGQKRPIEVRRIEGDPLIEYEIIDGERRWRACQLAGIPTIRCFLGNPADHNEQYLDSVRSNFGSEPHTVDEEINAVRKMERELRLTVDQIATECCQSEAWVYQRLRVAEHVDPEVIALMDQDGVGEGKKPLTLSAVLALSDIPREEQIVLAKSIVKQGLKTSQVKHLLNKKYKIRPKGDSGEPGKKLEKLNNFLGNVGVELNLLLDKDVEYFEHLFNNRPVSDKRAVTEKLKSIIADMQAFKIVIEKL